jgi:hypothetical protein
MRKGDDISKRKEGSFAHTAKDRTFSTLLARLCVIYNFRYAIYVYISRGGGAGREE